MIKFYNRNYSLIKCYDQLKIKHCRTHRKQPTLLCEWYLCFKHKTFSVRSCMYLKTGVTQTRETNEDPPWISVLH